MTFKPVPRKYKSDKMHWEDLIEKGGPNEFRAETVNGSARWAGTGWNQEWCYKPQQAEPKAVWPTGRSNRTGE